MNLKAGAVRPETMFFNSQKGKLNSSIKRNENAKARSKEARDNDVKSYKGPISLAATSNRDPVVLMNEIMICLEREKFSVKRISNFKLICDKKISVEVNRVGKLKDLFVIRIDEEEPDEIMCDKVTKKIFKNVNLEENI